MSTWSAVIDRQVLLRNSIEFQPTECLFVAHRLAQTHLLRAQQRLEELGNENSKLDEKNKLLIQQVRTLELAAAGVMSRTSREEELEAKVAELQKQVQNNITQEKDYYKNIYEAERLKKENQDLQTELTQMKEYEKQREDVLRMLKNEYAALKQENDVVRPKLSKLISEQDRCIKDLVTAKDTIAKMQNKILEYEDELNRIRKERRSATAATVAGMSGNNSIGDGTINTSSIALDYIREHQQQYQQQQQHKDPVANTRDLALTLDINPPTQLAYTIDNPHGDRILYSACIAESGQRIISAGGDRTLRHWDISTGAKTRTHSSNDIPLCLNSTSHYLLAGCADGVGRFWDTNNLRTVELTGHSEKIVAAYLSNSAHNAVTASSDRTIKIWDIRSCATQRTIMCASTCNDISFAGSVIVSAHYNGSIWVWDRRTATRTSEIKNAHQQSVTCVRLDHNAQHCISLGREGSVSIRDLREMSRELHHVEHRDLHISSNLARFGVSPNGKLCAVGNSKGLILFIAIDSGNVLEQKLSDGHQMSISTVSWALPDSTPFLVSVGEDKRIVVWK